MRRVLKLALAVATVAAVGAGTAEAQASGNINAKATVLSALSITGTDLDFANVAPTQTKAIAAASGGTFTVTGSAGAPVLVSFALPATLGTNVNVGTWTGLFNTVNNAGTAVALTVSAAPQARTISGVVGVGNLFIWVGATLTTVAATPGSYSAPVTLTVVYN